MAQELRPKLDFSDVKSKDAQNSWEVDGGKKHWFGPAGCFAGKRLQVFWDMDQCPLNAFAGNNSHRDPNLDLNAQQTYDTLFNVFCKSGGVSMNNFKINVVVSKDYFARVGKKVEEDITKRHSTYVTVETCMGTAGGKAEHHSTWRKLVDNLVRYIEITKERGEQGKHHVIVLITGQSDILPDVRDAVQGAGMQVLQLHPNGDEGMPITAPVWLTGEGRDLVGWAMPWLDFLRYHSKNKYNMRPKPEEEGAIVQEIIHSGLKAEERLGNMGIVLLLDATDSMEDAIKTVSTKIKNELLTELQERYINLRGKFRFAVVGYRDVGTQRRVRGVAVADAQFEVLDFVSDVDKVASFLDRMKAGGGGDWPEDIAGALLRACELTGWSKGMSNILFHIFDDPGHGRRFNDTYHEGSPEFKKYGGDRYFDQPPPGRRDPSEEITEAFTRLRNELNVIKYYALTINRENRNPASTAKTVAALKEIAAELPGRGIPSDDLDGMRADWIEEVNMGSSATNLVRTLIRATTQTLGAQTSMLRYGDRIRSRGRRMIRTLEPIIQEADEKENVLQRLRQQDLGCFVTLPDTHKEPQIGVAASLGDHGSLREAWIREDYDQFLDKLKRRFRLCTQAQKVELSELLRPDDLEDLFRRIDDRVGLDTLASVIPVLTYKILQAPFDSGAERYAYLALDVATKEVHVLKEFTLEGKGMHSINRLQLLQTAQTVAGFLASEFNKRVQKKAQQTGKKELRLEYLEASTCRYRVGNNGKRNRFQERFLLGKMRKFSNNSGYVAPPEDFLPVCDAFPHWTYHVTEGRLMVTDVQGWLNRDNGVVRLTDPCIHCQAPGVMDDQEKDRWLYGMNEFFRSHVCDETCKALELDKVSDPQVELEKIRQRIINDVAAYKGQAKPDMSGSSDPGTGADGKAAKDFVAVLKDFVGPDDTSSESVDDDGTRQNPPSQLSADGGGPSDGTAAPQTRPMCRFFRRGFCRDGDGCAFAHVRGRAVCRNFSNGRCRFGSSCRYSHDLSNNGGRSGRKR